jgi:hypothetical protein
MDKALLKVDKRLSDDGGDYFQAVIPGSNISAAQVSIPHEIEPDGLTDVDPKVQAVGG